MSTSTEEYDIPNGQSKKVEGQGPRESSCRDTAPLYTGPTQKVVAGAGQALGASTSGGLINVGPVGGAASLPQDNTVENSELDPTSNRCLTEGRCYGPW